VLPSRSLEHVVEDAEDELRRLEAEDATYAPQRQSQPPSIEAAMCGPARLCDGTVHVGLLRGCSGADNFVYFADVQDATIYRVHAWEIRSMEAASSSERAQIRAYLVKERARYVAELRSASFCEAPPHQRWFVWHLTPRGWERGHWCLPGGRYIWYASPVDSLGAYEQTDTAATTRDGRVDWTALRRRVTSFTAFGPKRLVQELLARFGEHPDMGERTPDD
jgi:hypothetical protein